MEGSDISQELSEEFMKYELPDNIVAEFIIDDDDPVSFPFYFITCVFTVLLNGWYAEMDEY